MLDIFSNVAVAGVPLLAFVLGLVQWIKGFGMKGNYVKALSMGVGVVFGVGYQYATVPPVDFAGWFAALVFGIALGLVASGIYDVANPQPKG
jgi:hypothetical protein